MAMPTSRLEWTAKMLDTLPDDGSRYEIIDGELFVTASPSYAPQAVLAALLVRLRAYLELHPEGMAEPLVIELPAFFEDALG